MSTKLLFVFGFILIVLASYFYASNNMTLTKLSLKASDIDYQAKNIHALQTDDKGKVNYRLTAQEVTHYQMARTGTLTQPKIQWQPNPSRLVTFEAGQGTLDESKQEVVFSQNVKMLSQPLDNGLAASQDRITQDENTQAFLGNGTAAMQLDAKELQGNLLTKQVISSQPIQVTQGNNSFVANSMKADLNTGDYEFDKVAMTFMPAQ